MYIPPHFTQADKVVLLEFMQKYRFAALVTISENKPVATHLPFIMASEEDKLFLVSHMARANDQWKHIEEQQVLVIFSQPNAYISPTLYEKKENVPTWNYVAVHAYGTAKIIHLPEENKKVLEQMMETLEPQYLKQWEVLPDQYKESLYKGLVAFKIEVTALQGKEKLSQNKTVAERENVVNFLSSASDISAKELGEIMASKGKATN